MRFAAVDEWSRKNTVLHRRDPRAKIIGALILLVAISRGSLLAPASLVAVGVALAELPPGPVLLRACVALPFSAGFALAAAISGQPFSGLLLAVRSYLSALCVVLLVATTPLAALLAGFGKMGAPPMVLEVVQFVHRYLFLVAEQTRRMAIAATARRARRSFAAVAGSVGVLFARSYDRAEAIHRSMLARGYTGRPAPSHHMRFHPADTLLIVITVVVAAWAML